MKAKGRLKIFSGRMAGRNVYHHEWFKIMAMTVKKGYRLAFLTPIGLAVFEFKGIQKPKKLKITLDEALNDRQE